MQVIRTPRFSRELEAIVEFIARDSVKSAIKFDNAVSAAIRELSRTARSYRKFIYVDKPHVNDFIYKGYVIPYRVNESKNQVELLGIFKHNLWRY